MESLHSPAATLTGRTALSAALVERACQERLSGDLVAARGAITSAIPVDPSPASRYLYAEILADSGDLSAAISQLEIAWEHARRINSPLWRAHCCHALAELHRESGRVDLANRHRQWAIRAELDADRSVDTATWLHDRAAESLAVGEFEDAEVLLDTASRIASPDPQSQARFQTGRGVVCVRCGRWSQGIRWFVRAFQTLRDAGDVRSSADTVARVGCVLQMRGEWRRAASCFRQAARSLRRIQVGEAVRQMERYGAECGRMLAALTADPERN